MSTNDKNGRNFIDELLDAINGEPSTEEPPTETEGFESLINEKEFKAILDLKKALDNYIEVHNECMMELIPKAQEQSEYQRIQVMLLGDRVEEAQRAILMMCGVHSCNKEFIDSLAEELGYTLTGFEKFLFNNKIKSIFG